MDNYADDVATIHLANVEKNIKPGGLLDQAKRRYSGGYSSWTWHSYVTRLIEKSFSINIGWK